MIQPRGFSILQTEESGCHEDMSVYSPYTGTGSGCGIIHVVTFIRQNELFSVTRIHIGFTFFADLNIIIYNYTKLGGI